MWSLAFGRNKCPQRLSEDPERKKAHVKANCQCQIAVPYLTEALPRPRSSCSTRDGAACTLWLLLVVEIALVGMVVVQVKARCAAVRTSEWIPPLMLNGRRQFSAARDVLGLTEGNANKET